MSCMVRWKPPVFRVDSQSNIVVQVAEMWRHLKELWEEGYMGTDKAAIVVGYRSEVWEIVGWY